MSLLRYSVLAQLVVNQKAGAVRSRPAFIWLASEKLDLDVAISISSCGAHQRWTLRHSNLVTANDIRKLVELSLASLINCLITLHIHVTVILHTSSGRN